MARPKRIGKKYDSFYDKVKDYHNRNVLRMLRDQNKTIDDKFSDEYNALIQLKSDIKERVIEYLDGALSFPNIVQYGTTGKHFIDIPLSKEMLNDVDLKKYPKQLQSDEKVRTEIEKQTQKFITEIFSEERVRNIFGTIFFSQYNSNWDDAFENYRIRIATLMIEYATELLQSHVKLKVLVGNLAAANEIAQFIRKEKSQAGTFSKRKRT